MTEKGFVSEQVLIDTANAIRTLTGSEEEYSPAEMAEAIRNIQVSEGDDDMSKEFIEGTITELHLDDVTSIPSTNVFKGLESTLQVLEIENVQNGTNLSGMLQNFVALTTLDISGLNVIPPNFAAGCSKLEDVTIENATKIYQGAFNNTTSLGDLTLPEVTFINAYTDGSQDAWNERAFYNSGITKLIAPKLTRIGSGRLNSAEYQFLGAFQGCAKLKEVVAPKLTYIGPNCFRGNTSLTSIEFGDLCNIRTYAFYQCTALQSIDLSKASALMYGAFEGCSSLSSVIFGDSLAAIYYQTFYGTNLTGTLNLNKVANLYSERGCNGAFRNCTKITSVSAPELININSASNPSNDYEGSFIGCTGLVSVNAPKLVKIGRNAFNGCSSLTTLNTPLVQTIEYNAFAGCTSLTGINLQEATSFADQAFLNCSAVTSLVAPKLTFIGKGCFSGTALAGVITLPELTIVKASTINDGAFYNTRITKFIAPKLVTLEDTPNSNTRGVFSKCTSLTEVDAPNLETIGAYCFYGCTNLVSIPTDKVKLLGNYALYNCSSLDPTTSFDEVETLGTHVFDGCPQFASLSLPKVTELKEEAFRDSTTLRSISASAATNIGQRAFYNCSVLSVASFSSVTNVSNIAFRKCSQLASVFLPSCLSIGFCAFYQSGLTGILSLPSVKTIYSNGRTNSDNYSGTFRGTTITSVDLPECLSLGISSETSYPLTASWQGTFTGCTNLASVNIPKVVTIGRYCFYGCTALQSIDIPSSCTVIDTNAFQECTNLTTINIHKASGAITGAPWGSPNATINWLGEN